MRAEPPVRRLAAVARSRGRLLPAPEPAPVQPAAHLLAGAFRGGWVPAPDPAPVAGLPRSVAASGSWAPGPAGLGGPPAGLGGPAGPAGPAEPPDDPVPGAVHLFREGIADRVPTAWRSPSRVVPARAALTAVAVAGALVLGLLAHRLVTGSAEVSVPQASPVSGPAAGRTATAPASRAPAAGAGTRSATGGAAATPVGAGGLLVVDVEGKVQHPGLVRVAAGSRVADAIEAAGGTAAGAAPARINLARPLSDGEQVVVPGPTDPLPATGAAAGAAGGSGGSGAGTPVNLNTAGQEQLDALPGVGPVLAVRIVQWRTAHGRFSTVDELGEVSGIGDALLQKLRPLVRV